MTNVIWENAGVANVLAQKKMIKNLYQSVLWNFQFKIQFKNPKT